MRPAAPGSRATPATRLRRPYKGEGSLAGLRVLTPELFPDDVFFSAFEALAITVENPISMRHLSPKSRVLRRTARPTRW